MDGISKKKSPKQIIYQLGKNIPTAIIKPAKKEDLYISQSDIININKKISFTGNKKPKKYYKKIFLISLSLIFIVILFYATFFLWKIYTAAKKMSPEKNTNHQTFSQEMRTMISPIIHENKELLKGEPSGRINILLMGAAGEHNPGGNLTDTIMIMSIDTKNMKVALLSLPRDLYINIPETNSFSKINSLYAIGLKSNRGADLTKKAVEKITGIDINYYIALDFEGFKKIIDDINGVNIIAPRDLYDTRYPGPNYSYETFSITKGFHTLDGQTTLKYARERHGDPEGDFGRAKRQQQIIQAVKNKIFSARTLLNVVTLNNTLDTLGDNIKTDISFEEISKIIELSRKLDTQNITNVVIDAWKPDSLLKVSHIQVGNITAFVLIPRVGNYSEIQDLAQNIFTLDELKKRQDLIAAENATIGIINSSGMYTLGKKIQTLLTDKFGINKTNLIQNINNDEIAKTIIIDNTNGKDLFTLDELIKKLPATLSTKNLMEENVKNNDIIIILGSDLVDSYKYEEATMQDLQNDENDNAIGF